MIAFLYRLDIFTLRTEFPFQASPVTVILANSFCVKYTTEAASFFGSTDEFVSKSNNTKTNFNTYN